MQTIDLCEKIETDIASMNFNKNNLVVVELFDVDKFSRTEFLKYKSLFNIDTGKNTITENKIATEIHNINISKLDNSIQFINLCKNDSYINVNFFKLKDNLKDDIKICSLQLPSYLNVFHRPFMFSDTTIFEAINENYSLFGYSEKDLLNRNNNYDKIVLIDTYNQCSFEVNPTLINEDSLLNFDTLSFKVFQFKNEIYFTAKTGAIYSWEKKEIFLSYNEDEIISPSCNIKESLLLFKLDDFVKSIKENKGLLMPKLIDEVDLDCSIEILSVENDTIIYIFSDFKNDKCFIKKYNFESNTYELIEYEDQYDQYYVFNNIIYGSKTNNSELCLYNLNSQIQTLHFNFNYTNYKILYIDTVSIILQAYNLKTTKFDIIIVDSKTNNIINIYEDRYGKYFQEENYLVLYKGFIVK